MKTSVYVMAALLGPLLGLPAAEPQRPNILFILTDDCGWSDTTLYGTTRFYETPNLERLAQRGLRFSQAYAYPMCTPSRSAIMSGLSPARTGLTEAAGHVERVDLHAVPKIEGAPWQKAACPWGASRLDTNYSTIAKSLKAAGYATGHFGKWHLGREPYDPLHQGFDVDIPHTYGPAYPGHYYAPWTWPEGVKYDTGKPGEFVDDRMADEAIRWMKAIVKSHPDRPFYCNFWMFSPHGGPEGKPALVEKYTRKLAKLPANYPQRNPDTASLLQEMDRVVGRMIAALDEMDIAANTLIIFASDNGGWCWPSGKRKDVAMTSNAPLRSGKSSLYEGGLRVPLVFVWPGHIKPDTHTEAIFSGEDFYPTILAAVGVTPPPNQRFDGLNQFSTLMGETPARVRDRDLCFFPHYDRDLDAPGASIRCGDWKLIRRFFGNLDHKKDQTDACELYDLRTDIGESTNLAAALPDKVKELDAALAQFLKDSGAVLPVKNSKYDSEAPEPDQDHR